NIGNIDATNVQISEFLQKEFLIQAVHPPALGTLQEIQDAGTILWNVPTVSAGGQAIFTYQAHLVPSTPVGSTVTGGPACVDVDYAATARCLRNLALVAGSLCGAALFSCTGAVTACFFPPTAIAGCPSAIATCGFSCLACGISPALID